MNENYFKQFRRSPDSKLVEKIHVRLERRERIQTIKRYSTSSLLTLIFLFGSLTTVSSSVRAYVFQTVDKILLTRVKLFFDKDVAIGSSEYLTLERAQTRFATPVILPEYIPRGYERLPNVELFALDDTPRLIIWWHNKELIGYIRLDIRHFSLEDKNYDRILFDQIIGENIIEEISLNGKPAVVRGGWDYDTHQYDLSVMTAIEWKYDENAVYTLSSSTVQLKELIRIAESIQ